MDLIKTIFLLILGTIFVGAMIAGIALTVGYWSSVFRGWLATRKLRKQHEQYIRQG